MKFDTWDQLNRLSLPALRRLCKQCGVSVPQQGGVAMPGDHGNLVEAFLQVQSAAGRPLAQLPDATPAVVREVGMTYR